MFFFNANYHQLVTNFSKIFNPFCECLGTFSRFPYAKDGFSIFFLSNT